jgi:hypothetical protein
MTSIDPRLEWQKMGYTLLIPISRYLRQTHPEVAIAPNGRVDGAQTLGGIVPFQHTSVQSGHLDVDVTPWTFIVQSLIGCISVSKKLKQTDVLDPKQWS